MMQFGSEEIKNFIESLKDWKNNFVVENYQSSDYYCELTEIKKMQDNKDGLGLINFWKQRENQDYFEIQHPLYNDIKTRAVMNHTYQDYHNFIFFVDEHNRHPFIIWQFHSIANTIICENKILLLLWGHVDYVMNYLQNQPIAFDNFFYKDIRYGFILNTNRPAHYFLDQLKYYCFMDSKKVLKINHPFFVTQAMRERNIVTDDSLVFFIPTCLPNHQEFTSGIPFLEYLRENIEEQVYNESGKYRDKLVEKDNFKYSLTLWLGIPGERRVWLEQWRGIPLILKNLSVYFPTIKVYVDGMTAYDGERIEVTNNLEAFWKIVENAQEEFCGDCIVKSPEVLDNGFAQCGQTAKQCVPQDPNKSLARTNATNTQHSNTEALPQKESTNTFTIYGAKGETIKLKSLSGYDYRTKICYCSMCDIVISETSTTALTPFNFCKKPGVAFYCLPAHLTFSQNVTEGIAHIKIASLHHYKDENPNKTHIHDYHFSPEHFYNLAAEALEELAQENKLQTYNAKNPLKMHRLPVPPVELYAKKYQLEQKTKITLDSNPSTERLKQEIAHQKTFLEVESLELDIELKKLQIKQLNPNPSTQTTTAKDRIHSHLAYKLGQAMILNSKSLWGYIRMPYVLSFIKESHKEEQRKYQERVAKNPALKLPKLESYPDYKEAIKEKQCFTYRLGEALMQADKDWLKGGYLRFYFKDVPQLKREFKEGR